MRTLWLRLHQRYRALNQWLCPHQVKNPTRLYDSLHFGLDLFLLVHLRQEHPIQAGTLHCCIVLYVNDVLACGHLDHLHLDRLFQLLLQLEKGA